MPASPCISWLGTFFSLFGLREWFCFLSKCDLMYPRLTLNLLCIQVGLEVVILLHPPPVNVFWGIQPKQLNRWYNFQSRRNYAGYSITDIDQRCRRDLTGLHLSSERPSPNRRSSLWVVTKTELLWKARMATLPASLCQLFLIRAPIQMSLIP